MAMNAVDGLARDFVVKETAVQLPQLTAAAKAAKTPDAAKKFVTAALALTDQAMAAGDYESAAKAASLAEAVAPKAKSASLSDAAKKRAKSVKRVHGEFVRLAPSSRSSRPTPPTPTPT